jgi:hypothetical protein
MEVHANRAANLIASETKPDTPVYFSPFTPAHPVVILRGRDLAPRPVSAFNSHECFVVQDTGAGRAVYVSLTVYEPGFEETLSRWAAVSTLYADAVGAAAPRPRYSVFTADARALTAAEPVGRFGARAESPMGDRAESPIGDRFAVWSLSERPTTITAGTSIPVTVGVRALAPPEIAPSLFLHLYGIPTPYDGGTMWSQADSQLCTSYPAHLWRTSETIVQSFVLPVPADAPPGRYLIAMGLYPFPDEPRLPVTVPEGNDHNYVVLSEVQVTAAP